jgi:hypothetical protein
MPTTIQTPADASAEVFGETEPQLVANEESSQSNRMATRAKGLRPVSDTDLGTRANTAWSESGWWREKHDILAGRWSTLDMWARLVLALSAALSAVSLLGTNPVVTGTLAVITAIISAVNAALDPATRAQRHRQAARDFRHAERRLGALVGTVRSETGTAYVGDAKDGYYIQQELTDAERAALGERLLQFEDELEAVLDAAPPVNRIVGDTPRTALGLRRLQRRLQRQIMADKMREEMYEMSRQ